MVNMCTFCLVIIMLKLHRKLIFISFIKKNRYFMNSIKYK